MNKPLIVHNIDVLNRALQGKITEVAIPYKFRKTLDLVGAHCPDIGVEEIDEDEILIDKSNAINRGTSSFQLPINSIVRGTSSNSDSGSISVELITYPWDFLAATQNLLTDVVTSTWISPNARISKTCIIEGPCIIEDDVILDDFCKVKGPVYISKGSLVGMCSLVRKSILGENTRVGFNCEVARSYFSGQAKIPHQNVILDSVIGKNVWFGGYSATANVLLTRANVKYQIDGQLADTGTDHFGAVVGNNSSIGAYVLILPGRQIPPNSSIQAGTIVRK